MQRKKNDLTLSTKQQPSSWWKNQESHLIELFCTKRHYQKCFANVQSYSRKTSLALFLSTSIGYLISKQSQQLGTVPRRATEPPFSRGLNYDTLSSDITHIWTCQQSAAQYPPIYPPSDCDPTKEDGPSYLEDVRTQRPCCSWQEPWLSPVNKWPGRHLDEAVGGMQPSLDVWNMFGLVRGDSLHRGTTLTLLLPVQHALCQGYK